MNTTLEENKIKLKIIGGTPHGGTSLCVTCRNALTMKGQNLQLETLCCYHSNPVRVRFPICECSGYDDKRLPNLYDMKSIAWNIETRNRGKVGFQGNTEKDLEVSITPPKKKNEPGGPPWEE